MSALFSPNYAIFQEMFNLFVNGWACYYLSMVMAITTMAHFCRSPIQSSAKMDVVEFFGAFYVVNNPLELMAFVNPSIKFTSFPFEKCLVNFCQLIRCYLND